MLVTTLKFGAECHKSVPCSPKPVTEKLPLPIHHHHPQKTICLEVLNETRPLMRVPYSWGYSLIDFDCACKITKLCVPVEEFCYRKVANHYFFLSFKITVQ